MVGAGGELSKALYLPRAIAIGIEHEHPPSPRLRRAGAHEWECECEWDAVATALCRRVLKRKLQVDKSLLDFAAAICRLASD